MKLLFKIYGTIFISKVIINCLSYHIYGTIFSNETQVESIIHLRPPKNFFLTLAECF